jgi:sigma-54 dependent transcriptional regulator, acetoin dehydrogenase operon transcriptional activator AcoR
MSAQVQAPGGAPRQPFFHTPEQRIALARQKFFEEGVRPTGAVGEAVIQSWMRCLGAHHAPGRRPEFEPVTPSRAHSALTRSRELLEAARDDLGTMETALAGTECRVILTDGAGVIVHAPVRLSLSWQPVLRCTRVGVDLAESLVGTTAPGVVAKTGQAVAVMAGEHFYESLSAVHCAAAPIRDAQGRLAGVLDLSSEGSGFGFHAASMVGLYATRIENRLLQMQSREHLIVRFQADPSLLHTPLEGLAGVGPDGEVRWLNTVAARMLSAPASGPGSAQALFGLRLQELLALTRQAVPCVGRLPSGLGVWLTAHLQAPDGANFNHGLAMRLAPAPPPVAGAQEPPQGIETNAAPAPVATLDDRSMQIIQATLAESGGNISRAARKLGVSRGLLYRRLKLAEQPETGKKSFHGGTVKSRC